MTLPTHSELVRYLDTLPKQELARLDNLLYRPLVEKWKRPPTYPTQAAFLDSPARYRGFVAGIGSGKSMAGAMAGMEAAKPGTLGLVIAPTYPMLRDASVRTFREVAGDHVVAFNKAEMYALLDNGSEVLFRSADAPDRLRGPNASWAWLDEGGQLPNKETWQIVIGRLRQGGKSGKAWATSTAKGYNWLYEVFGPNAVETSGGDVETFTACTRDNPYLSRDFVHALEQAYTGNFARQELEGAFVSLDGTVFRKVREAIMDGPWPVEPYAATFVIGLDWGQKNDYTVGTVMDAATRRVVDKLRINKVDWSFQREEIKSLFNKWHAQVIIAEANSIGSPNIEALAMDGIPIYPFTTTNATKAEIIQRLIMDFENGRIGIPNDPDLISELEGFEQEQTSTGLMKYGAPAGMHDDEVIALALANLGCAGDVEQVIW